MVKAQFGDLPVLGQRQARVVSQLTVIIARLTLPFRPPLAPHHTPPPTSQLVHAIYQRLGRVVDKLVQGISLPLAHSSMGSPWDVTASTNYPADAQPQPASGVSATYAPVRMASGSGRRRMREGELYVERRPQTIKSECLRLTSPGCASLPPALPRLSNHR